MNNWLNKYLPILLMAGGLSILIGTYLGVSFPVANTNTNTNANTIQRKL